MCGHQSSVTAKIIIRSLIFSKRKRDGSLKTRLVVDGRMKDRGNRQDVSSPTVSTESLSLLAAVFDAESRRVITDIEGVISFTVS